MERESIKYLFCQIAGIKYKIEYKYFYLERMLEDYIIPEDETKKSEDIVQISYTDEDFQKWKDSVVGEKSDGYIEHCCVVEQIASDLPNHGMLMMHGATIEYNGKAYIFTAPSGTGKSTHISLWKEYLGDKVRIINGDKPEITFEGDEVIAHGAPWCGKEGWQINTSAPLAGVCMLDRSTENKIEEINPGTNIDFFIKQFFYTANNDSLVKVVDLFTKMAERVPFYKLTCDISEDAAKCSFEMMTGEDWENSKNEN